MSELPKTASGIVVRDHHKGSRKGGKLAVPPSWLAIPFLPTNKPSESHKLQQFRCADVQVYLQNLSSSYARKRNHEGSGAASVDYINGKGLMDKREVQIW